MLSHPTIDRLRELGLVGMVHALEAQRRQPDSNDLGFEDRLAMLVDREVLERDNKRLKARLRFAGLRQVAAPEDVDYRAHRGLDRALFQRLTQGEWIERQQNLLITGPTGVGKTWLACALGQRACRDNRSVLYQRVTPLTAEQRRDLLEIIDDRHGRTSTIVTSQLPIENWHAHIGDPTIADAVLDRLVHSAQRLDLKGESLRKLRAAKTAKLDEATAN
jgi:DNA replication protein DnaC